MNQLKDKTYELAEKIQALAPWNTYEDWDMIYMNFVNDNVDVYVSIMGNAGKVFGIAFYEGEEGLGIYLDMLDNVHESKQQAEYLSMSMTNLTVYYDSVNRIKDGPFCELLDERYIDSKGAVPYFVRFYKQFVPYQVKGEDLEHLYRYLRGLYLVLEQINAHGFSYDDSKEIISAFIDDEDIQDLSCHLNTMPRPWMSQQYLDLSYDKKRVEEVIQNTKSTNHLLIIDCDYFGQFQDEEEEDKSFVADMLYFFNEDGTLSMMEMLNPFNHKFEIVVDMFCRYVQQNGIPEMIAVRKPDLVHYMMLITRDHDIELCDIDWEVLDEKLEEMKRGLDAFLQEE